MNSSILSQLCIEITNAGNDKEFIVPAFIYKRLVRAAMRTIPVDEAWYADRYPDVAEAIKSGNVTSCADHYITHGFTENRQPFPIFVDEAYYLTKYPDVAKAVECRAFATGQEHFDRAGFAEGRFPYDGFSLF